MMRNPVFESSIKRRMRSFRSPLLITLYCLFLILVAGMAIMTLQQDAVSLGNLRIGIETYIYLTVMQFALIILVAPALTAGSISGERERQTLDLLLCTRVSAFRIVIGKLLSSACFLMLMIFCSLPIMAVTLFFGGVSFGEMLLMVLFLIVTSLACCSIGIFCSSLFKRTVTATVVAYLAIFALGIVTIIIPILFQMDALDTLVSNFSSSGSYAYSGGMTVYGSSGSAVETTRANIPILFFLNPAVGLFSMLVSQTGMLSRTFEQVLGYRGTMAYNIMEALGSQSMTFINIVVLLAISLLLILLAAQFVKPSGRKAIKRK